MPAADTIKEIHVDVKRCAECGARFGIDAAFCPFDGVPLATTTWDRAGDARLDIVVDDRYAVLGSIGEGGMGTVYKVRHVALDRLFAMKVLRRDLALDTELAARFLREAKATAAVKHPSVVAITDFGTMEDGVPYFVMELLEGETLASRIRRLGAVTPEAAARIGARIAEALAASHAVNVIHRDLKPDNVFLVGRKVESPAGDEIRVVDFGAAKVIGGSKLTRPGIVFGTPYYMSPEHASGQAIDHRADVYSLGVLLYEMVTGQLPFEADTYMGVMTKHVFQAPPRPVSPHEIPLGPLEHAIFRALAKDPDARYPTMDAFARALRAAADGERPVADGPAPRPLTVRMPSLTTADRIERSVNRRVADEARRRRRRVMIGAFGVAAALGGGIVVASLPSGGSASSAPSAASNAVLSAPSSSSASPATGVAAATGVEPSSASHSPETTPSTSSPPVARRPLPVVPSAPPRVRVGVGPTAAPPSPAVGNAADDFKDPWRTDPRGSAEPHNEQPKR